MRSRGFTLIEILMVVFIIGLVLTMAFFTVGVFKPDEKLEHVAQHLSSQLRMAHMEAVFEQSQLGLAIDERGYRFYKRNSPQSPWELIEDDSLFKAQDLPQKTHLSLQVNGKAGSLDRRQPQVILTSGKLPTFNLTMQDAHHHEYQIVADERGEILWHTR